METRIDRQIDMSVHECVGRNGVDNSGHADSTTQRGRADDPDRWFTDVVRPSAVQLLRQ